MEQAGLSNGRSAAMRSANPAPRLAALFNIHPGEGWLVVSLVLLYFFLALAFVFTQTAAFALFLEDFGSHGLPYVYIAIAGSVSLLAYSYVKLAGHLALPRLLVANLAFLLIGSVVFRAGLAVANSAWLTFALPIWFQALINLGQIAFWTLAGRLFDVRQGKRLFGLIGSGYWVANIGGGFLVPPLVALLDTPNLLLLAAGSLAIGLGLLLAILRSSAARFPAPTEKVPAKEQKSSIELLKNRYVALLLAMTILWWLGFFFVDNIFYDRATARYANAEQLAGFLGRLFAAAGILGLLSSVFFTGRIIARYGLWGGRMLMPLLLTIGTATIALTGTLIGAATTIFWVAALTKLVNAALGFSLEQSALALLYQPLPGELRVRTQAMMEGMVQPLTIGLAGGLLLLFNTLLGFGAVQLSYLFLVIAAAWIMVVIALVREYPVALSQALVTRRLGGATLALVDPSAVAVVHQQLQSPYPGAVIYALNLLEQVEDPSLVTVLPDLLDHPSPEVRQDALQRIERMGLAAAAGAVRRRVALESSAVVRATAVRTLAALGGEGAVEQVSAYLDDPDPMVRRGAIAGLLRSGGIEGVLAGGQKLLGLAGSPEPAERTLAAQVLGDIGIRDFYQPLRPLLHDTDLHVRRAALLAAGSVKHPALWPIVVEALALPRLRAAAAQALLAGGEDVLPELQAAFNRSKCRELLVRLVRVAGKIRGQRVIALLQDKIAFPDAEVRRQILAALSACGYRATGDVAVRIQEQIKAEVAQAAACLAARADIGDDDPVTLLAAALDHQLQRTQERIFFLLSFLYDARAILRARDAITAGSGIHRAYALEVIDARLTHELKGYVLPLLDDLTPGQRLQRLSTAFPQVRLERERRLQALIFRTEASQEPWIRACALFTVGQLSLQACRVEATIAIDDPEPLVRETARWALACLDSVAHRRGTARKGARDMLSTLEKVLILKTVNIFAETPGDVLADVATLVEAVDLKAGETLFEKGDLGDSMFVVVSGRVRVHDGARTLNERGEREVFGEMALLDPEPRIASATALEDTHLFRLDREPFYELMADRPEVAQGIIRVLTGYVRARVRDVADLHAHLQEVKQAAPSAQSTIQNASSV